jgi:ribosome-associated translation inhibitor RaiA
MGNRNNDIIKMIIPNIRDHLRVLIKPYPAISKAIVKIMRIITKMKSKKAKKPATPPIN